MPTSLHRDEVWTKKPLHDIYGPNRHRPANHNTQHAAVQRNSGIGAAETEESVTLRRSRKRKRWDSQRGFTPDNITLGAMNMRVKLYT
jgi:hypothetical protein